MKAPSRLCVGLAGVGLATAACIVGPMIVPTLPPPDPVHAKLLPPLTRVTAVTTDDGREMTSNAVLITQEVVTLGSGPRQTTIPRDRVTQIRHFRFWLGSDRFGRDVLRNILSGGRVSLAVAALGVLLALIVGSTIGLAAASARGIVDTVLMRSVDALLAFPVLFLMILAATLIRPGPAFLVVLLGLTSWMGLARLVRGQVLSLRSRPFILAARASGSRPLRIATMHYAPNLVGPVAQDTALRMGDLIIAEATLSYLGLGVPPTIPTWGAMVAQGSRVMLEGWWLATFPGLAIVGLVVCLALIGDGLQQIGEPAA